MNYAEVLANARECIGKYCKACPVCNGVACKNQIPGPGAKGVGDTAIRNYNKWADIRVNMDTLCEGGTPDTTLELFGKQFKYPFFAGPVGAVNLHYSETYTDMTYNDVLVRACAENGIAAFTGDGTNPKVMEGATAAIAANGGFGIPTVKPWDNATVAKKMAMARESGCFALAMDIDAAGLPFLQNLTPPAGSKTVEQLQEIAREAGVLTVGVVTKPFGFEGRKRMAQAEQGIEELRSKVDSLVIIPNERLKYATDQKITFANAFAIADDVLRQAVQSISDLIRDTGFINLDFADVTAIMKDAGLAHMGVGRAAGKGKAEEAARMAISSPLLETSIHGARGVLINVTGSMDIGLEEVEQAASLVQDAVHPDALTIFGATFDESMDDEIRVTVIATGFADGKSAAAAAPAEEKKAAEAKPGIEPINYEEDKAAAEAEKKTEEEDDPFADIFKIFNRER